MLSNFVRPPRFEPATTGLSGKIHTHLTTAPSTWFRGIILWYIMVMTAEKATRLGHDQVTCLCRRFVDIQQSFSCIFRRRDGNDFGQFGRTWAEWNPRLCYQLLQIMHYFTSYADANLLSQGPPFHCMSSSVTEKSHVHTRIEQSVVFKIIFSVLAWAPKNEMAA